MKAPISTSQITGNISRQGSPGGSDGAESACSAGDLTTPGSGRASGDGNGNPLQSFCLENPMDRGACQATVHEVAKSWTQLGDSTHTHTHTHTHTRLENSE